MRKRNIEMRMKSVIKTCDKLEPSIVLSIVKYFDYTYVWKPSRAHTYTHNRNDCAISLTCRHSQGNATNFIICIENLLSKEFCRLFWSAFAYSPSQPFHNFQVGFNHSLILSSLCMLRFTVTVMNDTRIRVWIFPDTLCNLNDGDYDNVDGWLLYFCVRCVSSMCFIYIIITKIIVMMAWALFQLEHAHVPIYLLKIVILRMLHSCCVPPWLGSSLCLTAAQHSSSLTTCVRYNLYVRCSHTHL